MKLFFQLNKVDVTKREVYGRATQEVPDKSGEIFDYETSKPLFEAWSGEIAKATDGKSLGNVRAMHKPIAAGKVTAIDFNDSEKAIDIVAKVVDDDEWKKVEEGVYTGFSIGGEYEKRWTDKEDPSLKRFTAKPTEISLVDNPCVPTAHFTMVKADGVSEERQFKAPAAADPASAADPAKAEKVAARDDVSPKEGEDKYGDVKFADAKNKKYPIDTEQHIRAAWNYINKEKNASKYSTEDLKSIKAAIVAAWKKKISSDGPPSADDAEKVAAAEDLAKRAIAKSMYDVSSFATLISSIQYLTESAFYEAEYEQDASLVPDQLKAWLAAGVEIFKDMASEEAEELVSRFADKAAAADKLRKAARSKADVETAQAVHDHSVALGASCDMGKSASGEQLQKLTGEKDTLAKQVSDLTTERDTLQKRVTELEAMPAAAKGAVRELPNVAIAKKDDSKPADATADPFAGVDTKDPNALALAAMKAVHAGGGRTPGLKKS